MSLTGTIFSILFGLYQWWQKRKIVKIEREQILADTGASKAIEATNMMEVVNLFMRSMGLMRDELILEIKKVSNMLDAHALQDTTVQTQMNVELGKLNTSIANMKGDKGDKGDTGETGDKGESSY